MNTTTPPTEAIEHLAEAEQLIQQIRYGVSTNPRKALHDAKHLLDCAEIDLADWQRRAN